MISARSAGTPNGIRTRVATLRVRSCSATDVSLANLTRTEMVVLARLTAGQCVRDCAPIPRLIWPLFRPGRRLGGIDDLWLPKTGRPTLGGRSWTEQSLVGRAGGPT